METGLLNFHDEETFATSIYDQGDFSGVSGQMSILDMLHSDLQYSSDYLNQSAAHWDSDQEQEHNGDLAVLPVAPSECGSLNSSKEDYNKSLFEWQDSLMTYQPLDPDVIDLRLDGQVIPSELPDNIFEDSFESNSSVSSFIPKSSSPVPAGRSSTPNPCHKETNTSTDASLNLDVSLSALDVNVSDIDISALGINVSSLDIKTETAGIEENKLLTPPKSVEENHSTSVDENTEKWIQKSVLQPGKVTSGVSFKEDHELASLLGISEEYPSFQAEMSCNTPDISVLKRSQLSVSKLESTDVEQLHDIAMEFINEEQQAEAWVRNTLIGASLDCNVDFESSSEIPALKAGNLESLLEQFEATLQPVPEYSQSMPASPAPAYFSIPPSPLSMPASPSCLPSSPSSTSGLKKSKSPSLASPMQSPSKSIPGTPKKSPSTKLYQNILPSEVMDRIKASGRKKSIPLIPAMPSKKSVKSSTRMHAAGAALSRNKLLKVVSRKGTDGENIQFDHDYCSNDSLSNLEFVPDHLVKDIKASAKQMDCDDDKLSRKDSGLESGDFSEDSEGAIVTPANDSNVSSKVNRVSILKPRGSNFNGRNKEMLMVSVLKKVRSEATQSPSAGRTVACQHISTPSSESFRSKSLAAAQPASRTLLKPIDKLLSTPGNPSDEIKVSKGGNVTCERSVPTIPKTSKPNPVENLTKGSKEVIVCQGIAQSVISEASEPKGELKVMSVSSDRSDTKPCVDVVPVKSLEQPKKRKLNLEEYRSRLKAMEQKRENSVPQTVLTTDTPKVNAHPNLITEDKTNVENAIIPDKEVNLLNVTNTINMSIVKEEKNSDNIMGGTEMNESKVKVKSDLTCVKVDEETKPATDKKLIDQTKPGTVKKATEEAKPATEKRTKSVTSDGAKSSVDKKAKTVLSEEAKSSADKKAKPVIKEEVKPSTDKKAEFVVELEEKLKIDEGEKGAIDEDAQSAGEKKKLRQYRSRRLSTSSSDGSPSIKEVVKSSENSRKKSVWPQSKSRSRSASSSIRSRHDSNSSKSSRSRSSSSSNNSSSSSSSSSRSSSSMKSTHKRRRMAKTKRQRRRKRTRSSCSRSSSGSSSSRRSNSISSGSSRHSSQRARSRSLRRSRRERSSSRNRGRGGWRRRRRDSSRCRRSRSPMRRNVDWSRLEKEQDRQIQERRVVYVGRIPEDTTKSELRRRFEVFGPIVDISLHFREHADSYGFVTFAYQVDAYEAVERGNDDKTQPRYDLCFGGRRKFCRERYADLDGAACKGSVTNSVPHISRKHEANSFDNLLRELQAKLQARKKL